MMRPSFWRWPCACNPPVIYEEYSINLTCMNYIVVNQRIPKWPSSGPTLGMHPLCQGPPEQPLPGIANPMPAPNAGDGSLVRLPSGISHSPCTPNTADVRQSLTFDGATPTPPSKPMDANDHGFGGLLAGVMTKTAMRKRIDRLMKPRANGKLLVPQELADQWQNGDQNKLLEEFQKANFDKDPV